MSGRDRDHPIDLDDGEPTSYPVRRKRSKERSHKREATADVRELTTPHPSHNRHAPPGTRDIHSIDDHSPRRRHRKKHREDRHNLDRQRTATQDRDQPNEVAENGLDRAIDLFQPQWQADLPIDLYQGGIPLHQPRMQDLRLPEDHDLDKVNPGGPTQREPRMPDLQLPEDHDLDEQFWGQYLMNEPPFPEGDAEDLWGDFFINPANVNPAAPGDDKFAPRGPHLNPNWDQVEDSEDGELSGSAPEDEGDVQIFQETTPSVDDQAQEDACLARILELFPDICRDHFRKLFRERKEQDFQYSATRENRQHYDPSEILVQKILETDAYPKQKKDTKRKRSLGSNGSSPVENEKVNWDAFEGDGDKLYLKSTGIILQEEFPRVPNAFIKQQLGDKKSLYGAYLAIAEIESPFASKAPRPYQHLKSPRKSKFFSVEGDEMGEKEYYGYRYPELMRELKAARAARSKKEATVRAERDAEEAEALNEREHVDAGAMMECKCCFSDVPFNRTIYCDGEDPHFFCFECVKSHASNEVGKMRYQLKCMDGSLCTGIFSNPQLSRCLDRKTLQNLERLQQQEEIRLAGFEDLAECPFCDYKAIYPPVEIDKEFKCGNPECERVSCRMCNEETHIPKSCEENKKERHLPARHAIEEAMTEALIRTCPSCKAQIVKETGCNKMTCTRCFKMMCYICRKDISVEQYNHFQRSKCAVYDNNTEKLHDDDVAAAEKMALEKARKENPDISTEELRVKMKEGINKPTQSNFQPPQLAAFAMPQIMEEYVRGVGLQPPNRNDEYMFQPMNGFNDFLARRGGYGPPNPQEALGAYQPPAVDHRLAGLPGVHGAPFPPHQPYPDPGRAAPYPVLGLQAAAMQNPPAPRGRFPVVPQLPPLRTPRARPDQPQQARYPDPSLQARPEPLYANAPNLGGRAIPLLANLDRAGLLDDMPLRGGRDDGLRRSNTERPPRRRTGQH